VDRISASVRPTNCAGFRAISSVLPSPARLPNRSWEKYPFAFAFRCNVIGRRQAALKQFAVEVVERLRERLVLLAGRVSVASPLPAADPLRHC
jgi:hypothetical protein